MQIANPIYDVVMKYLLEDNKLARLLLGAIIGAKIEKLDFRPQEYVSNVDTRKIASNRKKRGDSPFFTVYRLDFSARIRLPDGTQQVLVIELQKAKFATDIMRFRRYLGNQYANPENSERAKVFDKKAKRNRYVKRALPILSIYFLGHRLRMLQAEGRPVVRITRSYTDLATGEILTEKDPFIESLTHDSIVIQIPELKKHRRNELEKLLSIFDQTYKTTNIHILDIDETTIPERFLPILRKLQAAIVEKQIRDTMLLEDEIIEELEDKERDLEEAIEDLTQEYEQKLEEKDKILEEKDKVLEEKDKVLGEKDKVLEEKDKALEEQQRYIEALLQQLNEKK
jgi:vacuolar-type H+-ATPase subunit H